MFRVIQGPSSHEKTSKHQAINDDHVQTSFILQSDLLTLYPYVQPISYLSYHVWELYLGAMYG